MILTSVLEARRRSSSPSWSGSCSYHLIAAYAKLPLIELVNDLWIAFVIGLWTARVSASSITILCGTESLIF